MKKKEFEQFKTKPAADLKKALFENRDKLWSLKTDLAAGKVKNVKEIRKIRKTIAQIMTISNQHGK